MRRIHRRFRGEDGFGLIEAMIAITVFAVGLIALAGMTLTVAGQSRAATYTTEQTMVAQDLLESELSDGYAGLAPGARDTTVDLDARTYSARIVIDDVGPRARRVRVRVSGFEDIDPATLTSLVHEPRSVPEEYQP